MSGMVEALGAARRALCEAESMLERGAAHAGEEWPEAREFIREHQEGVYEIKQQIECGLLAHAVLAVLEKAGSA